jgi:hypothetical protein
MAKMLQFIPIGIPAILPSRILCSTLNPLPRRHAVARPYRNSTQVQSLTDSRWLARVQVLKPNASPGPTEAAPIRRHGDASRYVSSQLLDWRGSGSAGPKVAQA